MINHLQPVIVQMDGSSVRDGAKQAGTGLGDGFYSMGSQTLVLERKDVRAPLITFHFDGASTDRLVASFDLRSSGDTCAEYRFFATNV